MKEWKLKTMNKENEQIEVKRQEKESWVMMAIQFEEPVCNREVIESRVMYDCKKV